MTSPDGIHWSDERQIISGWWDTCTISQNPHTGEYLVYHKREDVDGGYWRRTVFLVRSQDFVNWTQPVRVFGADSIDDAMWRDDSRQVTGIYLMSVVGHAGGFIGLPSIFRLERVLENVDKVRYMSSDYGPLYLAFASSPDGVNWMRDAGRKAILPNKPGGVFNACYPGCSSGGADACLHVGDETWLYTYCYWNNHGVGYPQGRAKDSVPPWSIGRAVWRKWGFVSIETPESGVGVWMARDKKPLPGFLMTVPVVLENPDLTINAKGEKIMVSVIDENGKKASCAMFSGDATCAPLVWDRPPPVGRCVRLRFELSRAALYAVAVD